MHRRWLSGLKFDQAIHCLVLEDCIAAIEAAMARRDRLEAHIRAARLADASVQLVIDPQLGFDLDTPEDLERIDANVLLELTRPDPQSATA